MMFTCLAVLLQFNGMWRFPPSAIFKESPLHNLKVQLLSLSIVEKYLADILELNVTAVDVNSRPILKT